MKVIRGVRRARHFHSEEGNSPFASATMSLQVLCPLHFLFFNFTHTQPEEVSKVSGVISAPLFILEYSDFLGIQENLFESPPGTFFSASHFYEESNRLISASQK